mmetsp:Transcript_90179/g.280761  ORF Transcript_90179/g.280761 Transcript_90179/m.280761 type:complete len:230 (+) Transcript_90179:1585-2274(+)
MVRAVLSLQLRGAVRLIHPRCPADSEHAVEDHKVVARLVQEHCHAQADVPGTDNHLRVRVLELWLLESSDAPHSHAARNLLVAEHVSVLRALLLHEVDVVGTDAQLEGQPLRDLLALGARLRRHLHLLPGLEDPQREGDEGPAGRHRALRTTPLVVRDGLLRLVPLADARQRKALLPRDRRRRNSHSQGLVRVVLQVLRPVGVEVLRRHSDNDEGTIYANLGDASAGNC